MGSRIWHMPTSIAASKSSDESSTHQFSTTLNRPRLGSIPKLTISREIQEPDRYDSDWIYAFRYRARHHQELPHVVKFSGGRSSGMLLFTLLDNGFLKQERGDVVVFNNTSCEHPETYKFVAKCKELG